MPDAGEDHLLPEHQELIEESAIDPEVARERGYRSVHRKCELHRIGFALNQIRVPALLIPVWNVHGEKALYQSRPNEPRIIGGKAIKYETPRGSHIVVDVPPRARPALADPAFPLFITEGVRKADAAVSKGLCCIALLGVWNFRGSNELGGKLGLPDWESIALNDRQVYIVFDSDVMTKAPVRQAMTLAGDSGRPVGGMRWKCAAAAYLRGGASPRRRCGAQLGRRALRGMKSGK